MAHKVEAMSCRDEQRSAELSYNYLRVPKKKESASLTSVRPLFESADGILAQCGWSCKIFILGIVGQQTFLFLFGA